ncbi:MAG TPA: DNA-binding domain-containing protein [Balneolaceae bacterium]
MALKLKNGENVYRAVVKDLRSFTQEDIIENMIRRGSTVTKADALACIEEYHASIEELMTRGTIKTPFMPCFSLYFRCF